MYISPRSCNCSTDRRAGGSDHPNTCVGPPDGNPGLGPTYCMSPPWNVAEPPVKAPLEALGGDHGAGAPPFQ